ncbi:MAG: ribonuclease R [Defluviicoccus sp.]|nr:MAG: ribonuclease R [Defluviicoccus sp.]
MNQDKPSKKVVPFPSREQILEFIRDSETRVGKREIARAFHLDSDQKQKLRRILKELEAAGEIDRGRGRRFHEPGRLPSVAVIEISGVDTDGETTARPFAWTTGSRPRSWSHPKAQPRRLRPGERVLARLKPIGPASYEARVIRRLAATRDRALGVVTRVGDGVRIVPVDKRTKTEFLLPPEATMGAEPGELVWAEVQPGRPLGLKSARVIELLGPTMGPRSISLITIHDHDIPQTFPPEVLEEAKTARAAPMDGRVDLRACPLVTIDGEDARDFDDAVWAEPDPNAGNPGGWHLIVAIADVGHYVQPGSPLDRAAFERGNSVYFPDRVVPMLPHELSNGWCSLLPQEDRPCVAAHLWINADGNLLRHHFERAMMRSAARLTYRQVQAARDGQPDATTDTLRDTVIAPLYGAFEALESARKARGVLELDVPERRVMIAPDGSVQGVEQRERLDSHKLIEEFMITANVAAAEALEARKAPVMYRVHDQPGREKLESLRQFLETLEIRLPRAQVVRPRDFNRILARVDGRPEARLVNEVVLRSQAQAAYDPTNIGHFGLALRRYCHFTSPIRRYADLLIHRSLIHALRLGGDGLNDGADFQRTAEHISATERRAAAAERDAVDRFCAAFLAEQVGASMPARIGGVTRFGLFVSLEPSGADALVPISTLPDDYYVHDEAAHRLVGRSSGLVFALGDAVEARLIEANPLTGGIICELLGGLGERRGGRKPTRFPHARSRRSHHPSRRR